MAHWRFSEEYKAAKDALKAQATAVAGGNTPMDSAARILIGKMLLLMDDTGPNASHASILDSIRRICKDTEAEGCLTLLKGADKAKAAGAIKNLRHLYLMSKAGAHDTWVLSFPKSYRKWTTDEVAGTSGDALNAKLRDITEYHDPTARRNLQAATQKTVAWSLKAKTVATSGSGNPLSNDGKTLIKRWFADEDHQSDEKLKELATKLSAGFGKIASAASSGRMVLTDNPKYRGDDMEKSEAFVINDAHEKLNVVYIEKSFFGTTNTLTGMKNWARILIHELSHSQLDTKDIKLPGDANPRYSWHSKGIRPRKTSFTTAHAIDNADNWAFFAVDAAGQLTETERNTALKPTVA